MTRKIEVAALAATLAITVPFTAAFAATRHQPAEPAMIRPVEVAPAPAAGFLAANGAAAVRHSEALQQAADEGHGGDGGNAN